MDYYNQKYLKLQHDFYDVLHDYPLFSEMIDSIFENEVKEINEFLEKNDEFYLKKAIDKLERLIDYIKKTSESINHQYTIFDTLARTWEQIELVGVSEKEINMINDKVKKANELIGKHDLKSLIMANDIMDELVKKYE